MMLKSKRFTISSLFKSIAGRGSKRLNQKSNIEKSIMLTRPSPLKSEGTHSSLFDFTTSISASVPNTKSKIFSPLLNVLKKLRIKALNKPGTSDSVGSEMVYEPSPLASVLADCDINLAGARKADQWSAANLYQCE